MKSLFSLFFALLGGIAAAQTYTVVADSLRLPNGLEFDAQGRLWVTESGYGFDDGAVSVIGAGGAVQPVVVGLPAIFDTTTMENVGPWHTQVLSGNRLGVLSPLHGGLLIFDLNGFVPGQTPPMTAASATSSVLIADFVYQNQPPGMPDSNPYTAVADAAGNYYIADAGFNGIVRVDGATGQRSVFCQFPPIPNPTPVGPPFIDVVPTRILARPGGGFYVCNLSGFPFLDGMASVYEVSAEGVVTPMATGFSLLTDLAPDTDSDDLYALQFGVFDLSIFNFAPNSAKVWRIHPDGTRELAAEGFGVAPGMALDGQGNVYVSELGSGRVLRFDGAASGTDDSAGEVSGFTLSPNPATDFVRVDFTLKTASPVNFRVLDVAGRVVFAENRGQLESGAHTFYWPCTAQPGGIYWVDIETRNGIRTQKLVLK